MCNLLLQASGAGEAALVLPTGEACLVAATVRASAAFQARHPPVTPPLRPSATRPVVMQGQRALEPQLQPSAACPVVMQQQRALERNGARNDLKRCRFMALLVWKCVRMLCPSHAVCEGALSRV